VISITRQMTELERLAAVRGELLESYREAIRDAADYAVAVEAERLEEFRKQLHQLAAGLASAEIPELAASREELRRVLAAYQADAQGRIERMRREVRDATEALQAIGARLADAAGAQTGEIDRQIRKLSELTRCDNLTRLQAELRQTVAVLTEQIQELRAENQRIVAQMRDEIRTLQHQIEHCRHTPEAPPEIPRAAPREPAPALPGEAEAVLHSAVSAAAPFTVVLVHVRNWGRLAQEHGHAELHQVVALLRVRLARLLGPAMVVATGKEDVLMAVCPAEPARLRKRAGNLAQSLAQPFSVAGLPVTLHASWGMIESGPEESVAALRERIARLADFVTGRSSKA
jgi:GGDEF domain-containing protein